GPRDSRINTLSRGLGKSLRGSAPPRLGVCAGRAYRDVFKSSVNNWSLVVITRLAAENPVEAMIRLMNSSDRSKLESSSDPATTLPVPSVPAVPMTAAPLLGPSIYMFQPRSIRPGVLL